MESLEGPGSEEGLRLICGTRPRYLIAAPFRA
jgi:hypothetical protein